MLSQEENDLLTRVGPGMPMGTLMRQYWVPALLSSELPEPDSPPLRVLLLGEKLIAFRGTDGRVGLLEHACPHRGASLFFGRNEQCGLRCVYHGWKFDVTGTCVDMPNEPAESTFKDKVRARAYPCTERGGIIWAYLGPRTEPPPLPDLEANMLPDGEWLVMASQQECNWLQITEGDIDTSHFGFLHRGSIRPEDMPPWTSKSELYVVRDRAPHYQVIDTDIGTMYGAYVDAEPGERNWRIALFLLPFYTKPPGGGPGLFARVPMDDEHTMVYRMGIRGARALVPPEAANDPAFARVKSGLLPNTSDWYGRSRFGSNPRNDFEIDRAMQRANRGNNGYTGIVGNMQDQAMTEGMGPRYDRSQEHLGTSDSMIIRTRRRLSGAVRALVEKGVTPPGVDAPELYRVRSAQAVLPAEADWIEATRDVREVFVRQITT